VMAASSPGGTGSACAQLTKASSSTIPTRPENVHP
jgi:hypothetical protein